MLGAQTYFQYLWSPCSYSRTLCYRTPTSGRGTRYTRPTSGEMGATIFLRPGISRAWSPLRCWVVDSISSNSRLVECDVPCLASPSLTPLSTPMQKGGDDPAAAVSGRGPTSFSPSRLAVDSLQGGGLWGTAERHMKQSLARPLSDRSFARFKWWSRGLRSALCWGWPWRRPKLADTSAAANLALDTVCMLERHNLKIPASIDRGTGLILEQARARGGGFDSW